MELENWKRIWRDGLAPLLSTPALVALREALRNDDPRLIQGGTTVPPPLMCVQDWPCEAGCLVGYMGWQGEGLKTVGEVEQYFARTLFDSDQRTGSPADCRHLLNHWDDTPRPQAIADLLPEVEGALAPRMVAQMPHVPAAVDPELGALITAMGILTERKAS